MKKEILFLSLSEFFPVYSKLCLRDLAVCRHLNFRYANEDFSAIDNDLQQLNNMVFDNFQLRGLASLPLPYHFNVHLATRIERHLKKWDTSMIFMELHELGETEFKVLQLVQKVAPNTPLAVMVPEEEKTTNRIYQLLTHGVKEVLSDYNKDVLRNAFLRHVDPYS